MANLASAIANTRVSIDPEPQASTTTGVLGEEEKEEVAEKEDAAVFDQPQQKEQTAAHASVRTTLRNSVPQAVGSGPQYKHQVRDVSQTSAILLEAQDQGEQQQAQKNYQNQELQQRDHYEPVIIAQAKLLPDADPIDEHSNINFGGDVNQSGRSNNIADGSSTEAKQMNGDGTPSVNNRKRKYWIVAGIVLVLLIAVIVGVVVAMAQGGSEEDEPFFIMAGQPLNGPGINENLGTALALSKPGHRMAVASPGQVWVYEYNESDEQWRPLGQPIAVNGNADGAADSSGSGYNNFNRKLLELQGDDLISIDINAIGDRLVVGYEMDGWVQIFRYLDDSNEWITVGERIERAEDRFGASVSINADGNIVAVGAPGQDGFAGYSFVFQRELGDGNWLLLGSPILGQDSTFVTQLGRSVSLSAAGTRVAVGGRSTPDTTISASSSSMFSNIASVYEFDRFGNLTWTQVGMGIGAVHSTKETGWYVDLDASGNRMAVSNTYLNVNDHANTDPNALVVQVYEFDNVNETWKSFGNRLHANVTGARSGYVISLSDDGLAMAMGDRG